MKHSNTIESSALPCEIQNEIEIGHIQPTLLPYTAIMLPGNFSLQTYRVIETMSSSRLWKEPLFLIKRL